MDGNYFILFVFISFVTIAFYNWAVYLGIKAYRLETREGGHETIQDALQFFHKAFFLRESWGGIYAIILFFPLFIKSTSFSNNRAQKILQIRNYLLVVFWILFIIILVIGFWTLNSPNWIIGHIPIQILLFQFTRIMKI